MPRLILITAGGEQVNTQTGACNCLGKHGTPTFKSGTASLPTSIGMLGTTDERFLQKTDVAPFQDALRSGKELVLFLSEHCSSWVRSVEKARLKRNVNSRILRDERRHNKG